MEEYYEKVEVSGQEGRAMQLGTKGWSPTVNQWTEWQLREADPPRPRTSVVDDNPSWGQVFYPGKVIDAAAVLGEVCHQDRACNGSSGELPERDRAFRGSSGELPERDRAFRGSSGKLPERDRAFRGNSGELHEQGRAFWSRSGELLEQDRAVEHGLHGADQRGDRALQGMRYHGGEHGQGLHQRRDLLPGGGGVMPGYFGNGMSSDQAGSGPKMELPALPASTTPMDLGDWLILVGPIMKDLSQHATTWWKRTVEEAHRYYEVWRTASPLKRVELQVQLPPELAQEPYVRTEQRGVGLLLRAVPEELKKVLISNRDVTSTAIIWRLLTTYQPGGAGEKSYILRSLTSLQVGETAMELATGLRQWRRCFQRAQEIDRRDFDGSRT